ncbi:MAG TPA: TetR family transcriptional regulator [Thermoanaerobaculia bacterium]|nr:TetR family transcriptional regulator [Thermoanaerobaculia bacterium]
MTEPVLKTRKAEQTRERILDAALELFRERGFVETTMRAIADAAGVAVGNAYYYFRAKEHLVQAFYERTHEEHLEASREVLDSERDFAARLLGVMRKKIDTAMPYHRLSGVLFSAAADPQSPLNPFSEESRPLRERATALFAEVLQGSDLKVSNRRLKAELPNLLWMYHMGILLFWIHDASPGCVRTYRLLDRTVTLVVRLVTLARLPLLRPLTNTVLTLMEDLKKEEPEELG